MLKDAGCKYVILGHSERRSHYNETDKMVKSKAEIALKSGLNIVICVGENLEDWASKKTKKIIRHQLLNSLPENATAKNTVIAYEPIWAIGTGNTATPAQVQDIHHFRHPVQTMRLVSSDIIPVYSFSRLFLGKNHRLSPNSEIPAENLPRFRTVRLAVVAKSKSNGCEQS